MNFFLAAPVYKLSLVSFSPFIPSCNLENSMEISDLPEIKKKFPMISWQGSGSFKATKVQKQTFMCGRRESAKLVTRNEHVSHAHAI